MGIKVIKVINIYELDSGIDFNHFCVYLCIGQRCDSVFDGCKDKPCKNGGTCAVASNTKHGYICKCPPVSTHHLYLTHSAKVISANVSDFTGAVNSATVCP